MVDFLWDRGRPRPAVAQKASGRKQFVLRTGAGEGARGPSKSGYQRPNLEFQTDPLPETRGLKIESLRSQPGRFSRSTLAEILLNGRRTIAALDAPALRAVFDFGDRERVRLSAGKPTRA